MNWKGRKCFCFKKGVKETLKRNQEETMPWGLKDSWGQRKTEELHRKRKTTNQKKVPFIRAWGIFFEGSR